MAVLIARPATNPSRTNPSPVSCIHNSKLETLKEVVAFYVRHTSEKPYDRTPGQAPALTEQAVDGLIAFLAALKDGYQP